MTLDRNNILVSFQNKTLILSSKTVSSPESILLHVSSQTNWPVHRLALSSPIDATTSACSYYNVRVISGIRGGKGGFGTLLKGSARQAGATQTTNFDACRDLQGRRLKHVNDQVAFQEWKRWNDKVEAGVATKEEMAKALLQSSAAASGVPGWYLQLPSWAEVSQKKQQSQMWKQFYIWKRQLDADKAAKEQAKQAIERQIHEYVDRADQLSLRASQNTQSALQEGLRASKRQRTDDVTPPEALITLSGDVVLALENERWCMQSPSNFCTVAVVLQENASGNLYYEAQLQTGGLCQIGWATSGFKPDSAAGDGVGDDAFSWAFDPSRCIKLHRDSTAPYGADDFKPGDVLGCLYRCETGEISYFLNGNDLGVAYQVQSKGKALNFYPAISCNEGEIVELRLQPEELEHPPVNASAVGLRLATEVMGLPDIDVSDVLDTIDPSFVNGKSSLTKEETTESQMKPDDASKTQLQASEFVVEPLDLEKFESIEELEALGLDRLKSALMAVGVKCGGSLRERATRLYSLKGLDRADYPKKMLAK